MNRVVNVRGLKQQLYGFLGVPRFRQKILYQSFALDDETCFYADLDIEVVVLVMPFCTSSQEQRHRLLDAASGGSVSKVEEMLQCSHDPDMVEDGDTALVLASHEGHAEVVRLLLEACAGADIADAHGATPLILASDGGFAEIVRSLLGVEASLDIADTDGDTALIIASDFGFIEVVRLLLEARAGVDIANEDGDTALLVASENGHTEVVCSLLEANAVADIADTDGFTAFLHACVLGHEEVARLLLFAGADKEFVCDAGTILYHASRARQFNIVQFLLNAGADTFRPYSRKGERNGNDDRIQRISHRAEIHQKLLLVVVLIISKPLDLMFEIFWMLFGRHSMFDRVDEQWWLISSMICSNALQSDPASFWSFFRCEWQVLRLLWEAVTKRASKTREFRHLVPA